MHCAVRSPSAMMTTSNPDAILPAQAICVSPPTDWVQVHAPMLAPGVSSSYITKM
jgi:hypothetical protein